MAHIERTEQCVSHFKEKVSVNMSVASNAWLAHDLCLTTVPCVMPHRGAFAGYVVGYASLCFRGDFYVVSTMVFVWHISVNEAAKRTVTVWYERR